MPDFTPHQKKIVDRYYENRDHIMLDKLSQLASELYLAESDKKRDQLWQRVAAAMKNLKIDESLRAHILEKRSPEILAENLKDWMK
jgi:hypothetical protein